MRADVWVLPRLASHRQKHVSLFHCWGAHSPLCLSLSLLAKLIYFQIFLKPKKEFLAAENKPFLLSSLPIPWYNFCITSAKSRTEDFELENKYADTLTSNKSDTFFNEWCKVIHGDFFNGIRTVTPPIKSVHRYVSPMWQGRAQWRRSWSNRRHLSERIVTNRSLRVLTWKRLWMHLDHRSRVKVLRVHCGALLKELLWQTHRAG